MVKSCSRGLVLCYHLANTVRYGYGQYCLVGMFSLDRMNRLLYKNGMVDRSMQDGAFVYMHLAS